MKADVKELRADIAIIGGGLGGCAAVLAAASLGRRVIRTEATQWLGGQLTSQAVPPDEHRWIETFGATASYRNLRRLLRSADRRRVVVSIHQRA
jgi:NADPH-dependent 2,4-dienoyl-CoA reductase/sulfur reductase-like enzyme